MQIGKILNNMEKYNHLLRDTTPLWSSVSSEPSATPSRPTSWGSATQTTDNIFDKKSPNYYKKVYPLTNVDLNKVKKAPKTLEDADTGGPPPSKVEKVSNEEPQE